ncbi:type IV pilus modification PilV family protein [Cloacibacillus evryensis]|mgnify:FL=1|uniref:type IV pilus modification PilV family protein n=1 Tax=Cloacibacillus evryensis TaxID=508460 RepID=UPI0026E0D77F|nr:hypothetical protein [Cloacibacillus evryensis]
MMIKRRAGTTLVEILLAVLLFAFGLILLLVSLTYSLNTIAESKDALKIDQTIANAVDESLMKHMLNNTFTPSTGNLTFPGGNIDPSDAIYDIFPGTPINYRLYKFTIKDKASTFYIITRRN